ncbi:MAG: type I methionyl aminopeptidase [Candidatus Spyradocola sp.]|nr:type I methionyl aminopeptidase [Candidatus Spyradocola sp.]
MITYKTPAEIEKMRRAGVVLYEALKAVKAAVRPGVTTLELDSVAERVIRSYGAIPSEKGYEGFPGSICASPDDMVVHGIPSDKVVLKEGQIISIDCTVLLDGYQVDAARTFPVGKISAEAQALIDAAKEAFGKGMEQALAGNRIGDISNAIQTCVEGHGYGVVRSLCGHGIGKEMHEDPEVPNFGRAGHGLRLREGLCIAVEPMITAGDYKVYIAADDWAFLTRDHSLSAHYENTLAITASGAPLILTMPNGFEGEDV